MVKGAAWSVPVVAVAAATPLAAASTVTDVDVRLSLGSAVSFNLESNNQAVADAILAAVEGPLKALDVWPVNLGTAAYNTLAAGLNTLVSSAGSLLDASISYPSDLIADNFGPGSLAPNEQVQVALDYDNDLVNLGATPIAGANIIQTGSGSMVTYTTSSDVANGAQIFSQGLVYNPLSLTVSLANQTNETSTVTATLASSDADAAGNSATGEIGITVEVVQGLANILGPVAALIDLPDITVDLLH